VWVRPVRMPMVALACAFHCAMACLLSVGIFPVVMFTALLSFLEERDLRAFERPISFLVDRKIVDAVTWNARPIRSAAVHLAAVGVLVSCGLLAQVHYDWYGVFGHRQAPALNEVA